MLNNVILYEKKTSVLIVIADPGILIRIILIISLFEVTNIVAAYTATIPITSNNGM